MTYARVVELRRNHHAFVITRGICVLNDVPSRFAVLQRERRHSGGGRDLDVHQGNGSQAILRRSGGHVRLHEP